MAARSSTEEKEDVSPMLTECLARGVATLFRLWSLSLKWRRGEREVVTTPAERGAKRAWIHVLVKPKIVFSRRDRSVFPPSYSLLVQLALLSHNMAAIRLVWTNTSHVRARDYTSLMIWQTRKPSPALIESSNDGPSFELPAIMKWSGGSLISRVNCYSRYA